MRRFQQGEARQSIANLTSQVLNPFLVSLAIILLLSFESADTFLDGVRWALIMMSLNVLPVYLFYSYLVRRHVLGRRFIGVRGQRTIIYAVAIAFALLSVGFLFYLDAPLILRAAFVAGLSAMALFMCVKLWWKISVHVAFTAASVTILVMLYGTAAAPGVLLLPVVSWARVEMGWHSVTQVVAGALLASPIVVVVFSLFGLL